MSRPLRNPNLISALNEFKTEIAMELSSFNKNDLDDESRLKLNSEVNRKVVSESRYHIIGFK